MKKIISYSLVLALLLMCTSCKKGGFFNEGEMTVETRYLLGFNYVQTKDVFDITLRQSDTPGIIIKCGEALIPGIKTTLRNDSLIIDNKNHFDWTRKYRMIELVILADSLKKISLDEPCDFRTDGVYRQDQFIVWATNNLTVIDIEVETGHFYLVNSWINTGSYVVRGSTGYAYFVINGSASLDASGLMADDMYVEQKSIDDMHVSVRDYLTYSINNSGNIFCYSDPLNIEESGKSGTGELIIVDN